VAGGLIKEEEEEGSKWRIKQKSEKIKNLHEFHSNYMY
jgi:hypothetical protein